MSGRFEEAESQRASGDVTILLRRLAEGESAVLDLLYDRVYSELRRIARGQRRSSGRPALETTALIHEAYLRFARGSGAPPQHREHFFAVAARAMRQILLDEAKARLRHKRGGGAQHISLPMDAPFEQGASREAEQMIALDRGLERLGRIQERARRVVECRYFGGMSEKETAMALGVDVRTIRRDWAKARAWLAEELRPG